MKVLGELQGAQLEQIAATSTTPASTGRVYIDVTTPAAAIPMIYNGASWRQIKLSQSTSLISQNSGTSCTVNWANGLNQQVILTANCVISFSNPVSGEKHNLVVTQAPYAASVAQWKYTLNMTDQDVGQGIYQPTGVINNGLSKIHAWFYKASIRAAYATIPALTFATPAAGAAAPTIASFSPDGRSYSVGHSASPFSTLYAIGSEGATRPVIGMLSPTTPPTIAAAALGVGFSPCGNFWAAVSGSTPFVQLYKFNQDTRLIQGVSANPAQLPYTAAASMAWHPTGSHIAVGCTGTPFIACYPVTNQAIGTIVTAPGTTPAATIAAMAFSPQGDYIAVCPNATTFLQVYPFNNNSSSPFGAICAAPASPPGSGATATILGKQVSWRPQGDYIAMGMSSTPFLYVVPFNRATGTFGTALSLTAIASAANSVSWTPDGQYLVVSTTSSPYLYVYDFSSGTIGTAVTFDGSNPGQAVNDVNIHPSGNWAILSLNATPYITGITLPNKARNYLKLID
jgi:hypothetical protein